MGDQDRLGVLEVGSTGHRPVPHLLRALNQDPHALQQNVAQRPSSIPGIHPHKRGDLIVSAPTGPQRTPEGFPYPLYKDSLERTVDVLIRFPRVNAVPQVVFPDCLQSGEHGVQVSMPQVTCLRQGTSVGSCGIEVVGNKAPIKVGRLAQPLQRIVRA
jgi:hypothetical protein